MPQCIRAVISAPGKINLLLEITGLAPNGLHLLNTVMHAFLPGDTVTVNICPPGEGIRVTCSRPGIPEDEGNIAHKAAKIFFAKMDLPPRGLSIHINKIIPPEAGLGGGSANAAAVLRGLDALFGTGLDDKALCEIAVKTGADVPFCLLGGCAAAGGIGEKLKPLPPLRDCHIAIAKPSAGVSTPLAYRMYDEYTGVIPPFNLEGMLNSIENGDLPGVGEGMRNVFESVIPAGDFSGIKAALLEAGALGAALSGSGSAVAALFTDIAGARDCLARLTHCETLLAKPAAGGAGIIEMS